MQKKYFGQSISTVVSVFCSSFMARLAIHSTKLFSCRSRPLWFVHSETSLLRHSHTFIANQIWMRDYREWTDTWIPISTKDPAMPHLKLNQVTSRQSVMFPHVAMPQIVDTIHFTRPNGRAMEQGTPERAAMVSFHCSLSVIGCSFFGGVLCIMKNNSSKK